MAAPTAVAVSSRQCTVCGGNASACNFGAVTCEPCKAFFRRATRSNKVSVCLFAGDCLVSFRTRRFCTACRLRKCEAAGMDRCLVLSEEQRRQRQQMIDNNKLLGKGSTHGGRLPPARAVRPVLRRLLSTRVASDRHQCLSAIRSSPTAASVVTSELLLLLPPTCQSPPPSRRQPIEKQDDDGGGFGGTREPVVVSSAHCGSTPTAAVAPALNAHSFLPKVFTEVACDISVSARPHQQLATWCPDGCKCIDSKTSVPPPSLRPPEPLLHVTTFASLYRRRLSAQTCDVLHALTRLYESKFVESRRSSTRITVTVDITAVSGQQGSQDADRETGLRQLAVRVSDLVSCCVLFARELHDVAQLPIDAQMALVKACVPTFILLRASELYYEQRAAWVDEQGDVVPATFIDDLVAEIKLQPLGEFPCAVACYQHRLFELLLAAKHQFPVRSLGRSHDPTVIALLQTVALLSPELLPPDVVSQDMLDALAHAQQQHVFLLRQHLEATCSFEEASELLPKLLCTLQAFKRSSRGVSNLLLLCDAVRGDELLAEILVGPPAPNLPPSLFPNVGRAACELLYPWTEAKV